MIDLVLLIVVQFTVALAIRLGYHKYTDETVYAINKFVVVILFCVSLYYMGLTYLSFLFGFFLVDLLFHFAKGSEYEIKVKDFIVNLLAIMPNKKEKEET